MRMRTPLFKLHLPRISCSGQLIPDHLFWFDVASAVLAKHEFLDGYAASLTDRAVLFGGELGIRAPRV